MSLEGLKKNIEEIQPDFIFHLAAQALVQKSFNEPLKTIMANAIGSVNILESVKNYSKPLVVLMITSDKVYQNVEWAYGYRETDRIGGEDPYSASKGMAELAIKAYYKSYFGVKENYNVRIGIARAGNVIGGGDWAIDRLVPDCVKAWASGKNVIVRNPNATRPWQHVLEPLSGYLTFAGELSKKPAHHGVPFNFGPSADQNFPVSKLIEEMTKYWSQVKWTTKADSTDYFPEAALLKLNCDQALSELNWSATLKFEETVRFTTEWYKKFYDDPYNNMLKFSISQIEEYYDLAKVRQMCWVK